MIEGSEESSGKDEMILNARKARRAESFNAIPPTQRDYVELKLPELKKVEKEAERDESRCKVTMS